MLSLLRVAFNLGGTSPIAPLHVHDQLGVGHDEIGGVLDGTHQPRKQVSRLLFSLCHKGARSPVCMLTCACFSTYTAYIYMHLHGESMGNMGVDFTSSNLDDHYAKRNDGAQPVVYVDRRKTCSSAARRSGKARGILLAIQGRADQAVTLSTALLNVQLSPMHRLALPRVHGI